MTSRPPFFFNPPWGVVGTIALAGFGALYMGEDGTLLRALALAVACVMLLYVGVSATRKGWYAHARRRRNDTIAAAIQEAGGDPILIFDTPEMKPPSTLSGATPRDHLKTAYHNYLRASHHFHPTSDRAQPDDYREFLARLHERTAETFKTRVSVDEAAVFLRAASQVEKEMKGQRFIDERFGAWQFCRKQAQWLDAYIVDHYGPDTGFMAGMSIRKPDGSPRVN